MQLDPLATPCGLYCGSCRFYINDRRGGCGTESRRDCGVQKCCRVDRHLSFCTECDEFPCRRFNESVGRRPQWLEDQTQQLPRKRAF